MDAGKFSNLNFGNVGGPNRFTKAPAPAPNVNAEPSVEDKGPRDGVELNFQPLLQGGGDIVSGGLPGADLGIIVGPSTAGKTEKSEPTFSLSGPLSLNFVSESQTASLNKMGGLTALNGINATSLFTIGGVTTASVSPMSPVAATRMPTTSVTSFGLEDSQWITSSGRVISAADSNVSVRMPTTSVSTFGLEDSSWLTTSGRTIGG